MPSRHPPDFRSWEIGNKPTCRSFNKKTGNVAATQIEIVAYRVLIQINLIKIHIDFLKDKLFYKEKH